MCVPNSPVTLELFSTSDERIFYAYFRVINEYWKIERINYATQSIHLFRVQAQEAIIDPLVINILNEMYGFYGNGFVYSASSNLSREYILRYVRSDPRASCLGKHITLGTNSKGLLWAIGNNYMALIHHSKVWKTPIKLDRVHVWSQKKVSVVSFKNFLFHAESVVLIPASEVIERILGEWTMFGDPTEYRMDKYGCPHITFKGWSKQGEKALKEKKGSIPIEIKV